MNWLLQWLARWWRSGKWNPPARIDYRSFVNGQGAIKCGQPIGISGLHLIVSSGNGREIVSAGAALDRDEFWKTWKYFGGQATGWLDEDGNEVDLTA